tara:strand:- start:612 stop:944 length:333 start_codon:yes stop_codon:yes gene_type:complete
LFEFLVRAFLGAIEGAFVDLTDWTEGVSGGSLVSSSSSEPYPRFWFLSLIQLFGVLLQWRRPEFLLPGSMGLPGRTAPEAYLAWERPCNCYLGLFNLLLGVYDGFFGGIW